MRLQSEMERSTSDCELSIVVPCYNEQAVMAECHHRLSAVLQPLGIAYECIYVDDGSRDNTWLELTRIQAEHPANAVAVSLSRNFGHQPAVSAGLALARGNAVVII